MPVRESMPRESSIAVAVERYWRFAAWFLMCAHAHTRDNVCENVTLYGEL